MHRNAQTAVTCVNNVYHFTDIIYRTQVVLFVEAIIAPRNTQNTNHSHHTHSLFFQNSKKNTNPLSTLPPPTFLVRERQSFHHKKKHCSTNHDFILPTSSTLPESSPIPLFEILSRSRFLAIFGSRRARYHSPSSILFHHNSIIH